MTNRTLVTTVALADLIHDEEANVRLSNRLTDIAELKASIAAHGILQSLRVRPKGKKYLVVAGNRRLAALNELAGDGHPIAAEPVPVIVRKEDDKAARELSTAENVERVPLTPVDEFKAFKQLHDDGSNADDIAERFGLPVRRVQQRLRLAALHPDVLDALEAGKITLEAAQAFTLTTDQERQRQYLERNDEHHWMLGAGHIRQAMTDQDLRADSSLAKFIGEAAYIAAGGEINRDLFGERSYWTSAAIIEKLVEDKWAEQKAAWLADGWAWVASSTEIGKPMWNLTCMRAAPLPLSDEALARIAEIEAKMEAIYKDGDGDELTEDESEAYDDLDFEADQLRNNTERAYTAEQKACTGVVFDPDGSQTVFGVIDVDRAEVPEDMMPRGGGSEPAKPKASEDPLAIGATTATALTVTMTEALRAKVAGNSRMALEILVATLHAKSLRKRAPCHVGMKTDTYAKEPDEAPEQGLSFEDALKWAFELPESDLLDYLAVLVASQIDVRDTDGDNYDRSGNAALIAHVAPDVLPIFEPEAYFAGVKKPVIVAAYKDMCGVTLKDAKKGEMVAAAVEKAKATGWLPVQLRTAAYVGPGNAEGDGAEEVGRAA